MQELHNSVLVLVQMAVKSFNNVMPNSDILVTDIEVIFCD